MRILHLEDSVADAELTEGLVREAWPECVIDRVSTEAEYQRALERGGYTLVLSDYSLPGFDGLTALAHAQRVSPETPFIFLSGTIGEERAIEALRRGANDYVIKDRPFRLVPAIRQTMALAEESRRRRRSEEALRQAQERFSQLAEQSSDVFWFTALEPERILYVSPAVERIWGMPASRFYADPACWLSGVHPDDRPQIGAAYERWRDGQIPYFEHEYRVVRPDGSSSWVLDSGTAIRDEQGRTVRLSGVVKDITARRVAEEQLREQAALLDKARDAVIATDLEHRIAYWNSSAERLYGWTAHEVFGRKVDTLQLHVDAARLAEARKTLDATGEWRGELSLRTKQGNIVHIESTWSLVMGANGRPRSILFIDTDVTEKKRLVIQVRRAERMDSIGMLAGGVAHDLNNALTPILMSIELLRLRITDPQDVRLIDSIATSAGHGAALVRQLTAFARGTSGQRTEVAPMQLIADVRKLVRSSVPPRIALEVSAERTRPILADITQVKQVLINLCLNARDAIAEAGRITITARDVAVDAATAALHPQAQPGPYVCIAVQDTGSGIPAAILDKIFDPFFTTKTAGKGTGLGLSLVAGIVSGHRGFVTVASEVGKGTLFELYFPALAGPPPVIMSASAPPFQHRGRGERVLLIDDDPAIREAFQLVLERGGYAVATAVDGIDGIGAFRQSPDAFAAVITDLTMPRAKGHEVIAAIRALRPEQLIFAISGFADAQMVAQLQDFRPPVEFLMKPLKPETLLEALAAGIGRR